MRSSRWLLGPSSLVRQATCSYAKQVRTCRSRRAEILPITRSSSRRGGRTKLPFGGSLCITAPVTPRRGHGPRQPRGPAVPGIPAYGGPGPGVARRTVDVSNRCTSWPPAIALSGRQGRSSRVASGPDPRRRSPGCISGAPRRHCPAALSGRSPGRAASVWVVPGAQHRSMTGTSAASWSRAAAGSRRTTGASARMRRDARKTIFDSAWAATDSGRPKEARA
jgi:hypothetical protein